MKHISLLSAAVLIAAVGPGRAAGSNPSDSLASQAVRPAVKIVDRQATAVQAQALAPERAHRLEADAAKVFGIKWGGKLVAAADRGFEVITDGVITLSHRPSGNAYFVQNLKASLTQPGFQGSDDEFIRRGRMILVGLHIDPAEIAATKILQQITQVGMTDPSTRTSKLEPPQKDRRALLITRAVRGLPIWSSRLMLDLDSEGHIVSLDMSWPKIEPKVLVDAIALQRVAANNYRAPEMASAKPESATAGILHSPAAAFVDDQVAAIRVIYRPTDQRIGKKPVVYLGLDAKPVAIPRQLARQEGPAPSRIGKSPKPR